MVARKSLVLCLMLLGFSVTAVRSEMNPSMEQAPALNRGAHKVIAYYSHTSTLCRTCRKIEVHFHEAIDQGFPGELKNGLLEMPVINCEQPENCHFIQDYKLVSKSLVLVNVVNGKQKEYTNLKLAWQLTGHKDAFLNYVRKEVRNYQAKGRQG